MKQTGLKKNYHLTKAEKVKLIEKNNMQVSIKKQCELLGLNRSSLYYQEKSETEENVKMMGLIDEIYTEFPYYGSPRITEELKRRGCLVNHKRIERLMLVMGLVAIFPKRNLSRRNPNHQIYPYLLKGLVIIRINQVWGIDITYVRANGVWFYLVAVIDWYSRFVLAWKLSETITSDFCVEAVKEALRYGKPGIHNSDQGSQFTDKNYISVLNENGIKISMDGRGRCFDNIFTERLWRTVKYEEIYLKDYESFEDARQNLEKYFQTYNYKRLHQSLNYQTPAEIYFAHKKSKVETIKSLSIYPQFAV